MVNRIGSVNALSLQHWTRASRMSWPELRFRVAQEWRKRYDWARYSLGLPHAPGVCKDRAFSGNFFFTDAEVRERVSLLRSHLNHEVEQMIEEAEEICGHRFPLLGYSSVNYGEKIDWHRDPINRKQAPRVPWYKVPYLDCPIVGDHKVIWELNRHQHLVVLAKAWQLTDDSKYVKEAIHQWYDWQNENPYPIGINWASSLEVAFRSLSWLWLRALVANCIAVPVEFERDVEKALATSARHIERYLSTYFSPNTHLLGEAVALFFIGTVCPQIGAAERWRRLGWKLLLEQCQRQVLPDGVYFEHSLYYHVYALDFFLHARVLAERSGVEIPSSFDAVLQRMLSVLAALSEGGHAAGFGDDDGGRVFSPRRNRPEHLSDPLAVGSLVFGRSDFGHVAKLTEEAIWLFGERALGLSEKWRHYNRRIASEAFEAGGIYVMAARKNRLEQMTVLVGPRNGLASGHRHADGLSVTLTIDGQHWLVDSGTGSYVSSARGRFRSTAAHNTMRVDSIDQAIPDGLFRWRGMPLSETEVWIPGQTFALLTASHDGYARLTAPVKHRRTVFHLFGEFWFVRDFAKGSGEHDLEISWHFAPEVSISKSKSAIRSLQRTAGGERNLLMLPVIDPEWRAEISVCDTSPAYGMLASAQRCRFSTRANLPAEHAVILHPDTSAKPGSFSRALSTDVSTYKYEENGKSHYLFFSTCRGREWANSGFASDGEFFYCCLAQKRVLHAILCRGTFANFDTKPLVSLNSPVEHIEIVDGAGEMRMYSSDEALVNGFSEVVQN